VFNPSISVTSSRLGDVELLSRASANYAPRDADVVAVARAAGEVKWREAASAASTPRPASTLQAKMAP
jgi:hypothetical protein